jgi:hypothetical protein
MMQAFVLAGPALQVESAGPSVGRSAAKPTAGYDVLYSMLAVTIERIEAAAEDSFAAILARSRFGIAIAAMIKMIATTISNSINEKPFCLRISKFPPDFSEWSIQRPARIFALCFPFLVITKVFNLN